MTLLAKFKFQNEPGRNKAALERPQKILLPPARITRKGRVDTWPVSRGVTAGHIAPSQGTHKEMFAAVTTLAHLPTNSK